MSKEDAGRKNIVVVGGGAGGATAARSISAKLDASKFKLIVINPRPYSILYPATARLVVSDAEPLEDKVFVPFDKLFHNGKGTFLQGKVTAIEKTGPGAPGGHVVLESGEQVPFEVLVLAPGSIWAGPLAFPDDTTEVSAFIAKGRAALKAAKNVILVGGGAVGIGMDSFLFQIVSNLMFAAHRNRWRNQRPLSCMFSLLQLFYLLNLMNARIPMSLLFKVTISFSIKLIQQVSVKEYSAAS